VYNGWDHLVQVGHSSCNLQTNANSDLPRHDHILLAMKQVEKRATSTVLSDNVKFIVLEMIVCELNYFL
jgi:hypothetical protein